MELFKAMAFGALVSVCIAVVIGSQGSAGGQLAIQSLMVADQKVYWSWPIFLAGTGVFWGLMLLQK